MTRYQRQLGFKKGDKVVVKRNCEVFTYSETDEMKRYRENQIIGTITGAEKDIVRVCFKLPSCGWSYHPDELELVSRK